MTWLTWAVPLVIALGSFLTGYVVGYIRPDHKLGGRETVALGYDDPTEDIT